MGKALCDGSAAARAIYTLADRVTGLPITNLCREGSIEDLTPTEIAQVAVVTTSLATAAAIEECMGQSIPAVAVAGHSVGELAAMVCAGAIEAETALRLVHRRGALIAEACSKVDGSMAAVFGLEPDILEPICAAASSEIGCHVQVANLNAPGQVVLSGERAALDRAIEKARSQGAQRAISLKVSGPFHSVYMQPAADAFREFCADLTVAIPRMPVVLNPSAQAEQAPEALRSELSLQITQPVRWVKSLRTMWELGCRCFIEVGPGKVLTGLVRRTLPEAKTHTVGTPPEAAAVAAALL